MDENAMLYGVCEQCGKPRMAELTYFEGGMGYRVVCSGGHDQDECQEEYRRTLEGQLGELHVAFCALGRAILNGLPVWVQKFIRGDRV